jgi:2-polyprenyl-3-methyl-5-hydroxy-6-metoxy-1,4-benzoquinol methylase
MTEKLSIEELTWTPQMIARYWDFESRFQENFFTYQVGRVLVRHFRGFLNKPKKIIDYGAGAGFLIEELLHENRQCAAIEFAPDAVRLVQSKFQGNPKFLGARLVGNLQEWNGQFDVAFLTEVVEHLYDADLHRCLSCIHDLLAPGGLLILTTPNDEDRSKSMLLNPETGRVFHRWQHVRSWTPLSLQDLLQTRSFSPVEIGTTDFGASIHAMRRSHLLPMRLARAAVKRFLLLLGRKPPHLYAVAKRN